MNCASCGIQNVEFATRCYACGQQLGGAARRILAAAAPAPQAPHVPHHESHASHHAPRESYEAPSHTPQPTVKAPSGAAAVFARLIFFGAIAFFFFREPISQLLNALQSIRSESPTSVETSPPPPPAPREAASEAPAAPPAAPEEAAESLPEEYPAAAPPQEINGFTMALFEWEQTEPVHFGDVVGGRSQITGFEVSRDNRIDITMRFTFRDPNGTVVEKESPTRLDQPVESDTLFSTFNYTIPQNGPAGDYDLEIRVDDAVSGRSARFHRTLKAVR